MGSSLLEGKMQQHLEVWQFQSAANLLVWVMRGSTIVLSDRWYKGHFGTVKKNYWEFSNNPETRHPCESWSREQQKVLSTYSSHLIFICFAPSCKSIGIQQKKLNWSKIEERLQTRINKNQVLATPWGPRLLKQISASALEWRSYLSGLSKPGYSRAHVVSIGTGPCTPAMYSSELQPFINPHSKVVPLPYIYVNFYVYSTPETKVLSPKKPTNTNVMTSLHYIYSTAVTSNRKGKYLFEGILLL